MEGPLHRLVLTELVVFYVYSIALAVVVVQTVAVVAEAELSAALEIVAQGAVAVFGTLHSLLPMFAVEGAVDEKIGLVTPVVDATGVDIDEKID